jgi:hypothetical protein
MAQHGIDCLLVTDPVSFTYFSGQNAPVRMKLRPSVFVLASSVG